ncbi:MAG: isopentenyl transferase family protein, partial [Verrucomicrobiales bacterium]
MRLDSSPYQPFYLVGPTGVGKSAVALALAQRRPGVELVNADAFQIYQGLDIL